MEPIIGQIMLFAGSFAPRGWAFCDGQLVQISQNEALFAILGVTYGGDGRTTFALPDLRGRTPVHAGQGDGLTARKPGDAMGQEDVTLTAAQMPAHRHDMSVCKRATHNTPKPGDALGRAKIYVPPVDDAAEPDIPLNDKTIGSAGDGAPHNNMQPSLCINYIIALQGIFPSRS